MKPVDTARHLVTGQPFREGYAEWDDIVGAFTGTNEVDFRDVNPTSAHTAGVGDGNFEGQGLTAIMDASAAQSAGLDSGAGSRGDAVNMDSANDNSGGANGGPSADAYGPRFVGRS